MTYTNQNTLNSSSNKLNADTESTSESIQNTRILSYNNSLKDNDLLSQFSKDNSKENKEFYKSSKENKFNKDSQIEKEIPTPQSWNSSSENISTIFKESSKSTSSTLHPIINGNEVMKGIQTEYNVLDPNLFVYYNYRDSCVNDEGKYRMTKSIILCGFGYINGKQDYNHLQYGYSNVSKHDFMYPLSSSMVNNVNIGNSFTNIPCFSSELGNENPIFYGTSFSSASSSALSSSRSYWLGLDSKANFDQELEKDVNANSNFYLYEDIKNYNDLDIPYKRLEAFKNFKEILYTYFLNYTSNSDDPKELLMSLRTYIGKMNITQINLFNKAKLNYFRSPYRTSLWYFFLNHLYNNYSCGAVEDNNYDVFNELKQATSRMFITQFMLELLNYKEYLNDWMTRLMTTDELWKIEYFMSYIKYRIDYTCFQFVDYVDFNYFDDYDCKLIFPSNAFQRFDELTDMYEDNLLNDLKEKYIPDLSAYYDAYLYQIFLDFNELSVYQQVINYSTEVFQKSNIFRQNSISLYLTFVEANSVEYLLDLNLINSVFNASLQQTLNLQLDDEYKTLFNVFDYYSNAALNPIILVYVISAVNTSFTPLSRIRSVLWTSLIVSTIKINNYFSNSNRINQDFMEKYAFVFTDRWFIKYGYSITEFLFLDLQEILAQGLNALLNTDPETPEFLDQCNNLSQQLMQPIVAIENNLLESALKAYNLKFISANNHPDPNNPSIKAYDYQLASANEYHTEYPTTYPLMFFMDEYWDTSLYDFCSMYINETFVNNNYYFDDEVYRNYVVLKSRDEDCAHAQMSLNEKYLVINYYFQDNDATVDFVNRMTLSDWVTKYISNKFYNSDKKEAACEGYKKLNKVTLSK